MWVDPDIVIIYVLITRRQGSERPAAIVRNGDVGVHDVDAVGVRRIYDNLGVILPLYIVCVALLPGRSGVRGPSRLHRLAWLGWHR